MMQGGEFGEITTSNNHLEKVIAFEGTRMFNPVGQAISFDCGDKTASKDWRAYLASGGAGSGVPAEVTVIDLGTNKIVKKIDIGSGLPQGVAVTPCL